MEDIQAQNFKSFATRFQLAEQLEKGDRGVIFIGNTRAGKTTLSCAAAGANIKIKHDSSRWQTYLHPADQKYTNLVRDSDESVTTIPNFFKINQLNNQIAIVDMPGYADSSRFKQLINYHYIKTMITNLKQIRFLVIIPLSYSAGKYYLQDVDKRMLQNFADTFPKCRQCISIIINRVQHNNDVPRHKEIEIVKGAFRDIRNEYPKIKKHLQLVPNQRIYVIFRPPYKENKEGNDWTEDYPQITQTMKTICMDNTAKFMSIQNLQTKVQIFKEGDNTKNNDFKKQLQQILKEQKTATSVVKDCFQSIVIKLMQGIISKKINQQQYQIEQLLDNFQSKDQTQHYKKHQKLIEIESHNTHYTMVQSKIIKLFITLIETSIGFEDPKANEFSILSSIHTIFGQLSLITNNLYLNNKKLKLRMNYLHIYTARRVKESYFIYKSINDQKIMDVQSLNYIILGIVDNITEFNKFENYIAIFRDYLQKIVDPILQINLKTTFGNNFGEVIKKELLETLDHIKILYKKNILNEQPGSIIKVDAKIKEIELYYLIVYTPTKPEEVQNYITKLLNIYHTVQNKEQKLKIVIKLSSNLAKKQPKYAIALYFHLQIFEEVLRLVETLYDPKKNEPKKIEIVVKWYLQLAEEFKDKKKAYYFERCLQKVKALCYEDSERLTDIIYSLEEGLHIISKQVHKSVSSIKDKKIEIYNWNKIDKQVAFLKFLHKLQKKTKNYEVIGETFRE